MLTEPKILSPDEIIQQALDDGYKSFYPLCSGGKDSITTTHFIKENYPNQFKTGIYTVTGVGVKGSRQFVVDYFKEMNWSLQFTWTPYNFTDFVLLNGFPSPEIHNIVMFQLKFITWRLFEQEHRNEKMLFIGGIRKKESKRRGRKKQYAQPFHIDGKTAFCNPFLFKSGTDIWKYHAEHDLKLTPIHQILNLSGDCMCGCFAEKWELALIKKYYPDTFNYFKWLERRIQDKIIELKIKLNASESQVVNWCRMVQDKVLRKYLTPLQKQLANLTVYPTWAHGKHRSYSSTLATELQASLDDFEQKNLGNILCGESCAVNE